MGDRETWDARHAERAGDAGTPEPFVLEALDRLGPGAGRRALDLASGTGRNAHALLDRGWTTSAWDFSPVAGRVLSERSGGRVEWREIDLSGGPLPRDVEPFDLVVLVNFLDRGLLARVGELVRPGGHLVFATFTKERAGERPPLEYCLEPGELARGLPGFETVEHREEGGRATLLARRLVAGEAS